MEFDPSSSAQTKMKMIKELGSRLSALADHVLQTRDLHRHDNPTWLLNLGLEQATSHTRAATIILEQLDQHLPLRISDAPHQISMISHPDTEATENEDSPSIRAESSLSPLTSLPEEEEEVEAPVLLKVYNRITVSSDLRSISESEAEDESETVFAFKPPSVRSKLSPLRISEFAPPSLPPAIESLVDDESKPGTVGGVKRKRAA